MSEDETEVISIEELKESTNRVYELEKLEDIRLRSLEWATFSSVTIDDNSTIVAANLAIQKIIGWTPAELVGKPLTVIMPERLRARHLQGFMRYRYTGERHLDWGGVPLDALHKDGHEVPVRVSFNEFRLENERFITGTIVERQ